MLVSLARVAGQRVKYTNETRVVRVVRVERYSGGWFLVENYEGGMEKDGRNPLVEQARLYGRVGPTRRTIYRGFCQHGRTEYEHGTETKRDGDR